MSKIASKTKQNFLTLLKVQLDAGLGYSTSLHTLGSASYPKHIQDMSTRMLSKIEQGATFHEAAKQCPALFNSYDLAVIQCGERNGNVGLSLGIIENASTWLSKIHRKVISAAIYPFVILNVASLTLRIHVLLDGSVAAYLGGWILMNIILAMTVFAFSNIRKFPTLRTWTDHSLLHLPGLSQIFAAPILNYNKSVFYRLFSEILNAGSPLQQGIETAAESVRNSVFQEDLLNASKKLGNGAPIADALAHSRYLSVPEIAMIKTAEHAGSLPDILKKLSDQARFSVEQWLTVFYKMLPLVFFILLSIPVIISIFSTQFTSL